MPSNVKNWRAFYFRDIMNVSFFLIKDMIEAKKLRYFVILLKMKSIYSSGCIHNYSPYKLSKTFNLSRNSIKKYVDWCLDNGFARMEENNLIFNPFRKINPDFNFSKIKININLPIKNIEALLYKELLQSNKNRFDYCKKVENDSIKPKGPTALKDLKKAKKALIKMGKSEEQLPSADAEYSVSIIKLSKDFNCSVGKAFNIVSSMCEYNCIVKKKNWLLIANNVNKGYAKELILRFKNIFYADGKLFKMMPNIYIF